MVTYDVGTNIGYDFDVNLQINDDECKFSAKEIKTKIMLALNKVAHRLTVVIMLLTNFVYRFSINAS